MRNSIRFNTTVLQSSLSRNQTKKFIKTLVPIRPDLIPDFHDVMFQRLDYFKIEWRLPGVCTLTVSV